jgi:hypothetical protein
MTVIVYRDGVMAADTGGFMGELLVSTTERKIIRTPAGHLVGCAGSLPDIMRFHEWAMDGFRPGDRPQGLDNFGALTVSPEGVITKYNAACHPYPNAMEWGIEGCAEEFLMGALVSGKSAAEAVELAIRYCVWAGGKVQTERLEG